jgi:hypothetical protein
MGVVGLGPIGIAIGLVGATVGGIGFGIYKIVTRDRKVKVFKEMEGAISRNSDEVEYAYNSTMKTLLLNYIPVVGIQLSF